MIQSSLKREMSKNLSNKTEEKSKKMKRKALKNSTSTITKKKRKLETKPLNPSFIKHFRTFLRRFLLI